MTGAGSGTLADKRPRPSAGFGAASAVEYATAVASGGGEGEGAARTLKSLTLASPFVQLGGQALQALYASQAAPVPLCVEAALNTSGLASLAGGGMGEVGGEGVSLLRDWATPQVLGKLGGPVAITYGG
jgi:hypothetical protein